MQQKTFFLDEDNRYLHFPIHSRTVSYGKDLQYRFVRFMHGQQMISEVCIKLSDTPDFYAPRFFGEYDSVTLVCEDPDAPDHYFDGIKVGKAMAEEPELYPDLYREKYRNHFHFSPARGWLNDPNGLVYANGQYHLYFQHNPLGTTHGGVNISWGHATSDDGVYWTEHHDAIYNRSRKQIAASGSAWCDEENMFGLGKNTIISAHTELNASYFMPGTIPPIDGQFIMYSTDNGMTFQNAGKNPKLEVPAGEYWRDPKLLVIDKTMLMLVYETYQGKNCVTVYASEDLEHWEIKSRSLDIYECPDLFVLPVRETGELKWILYGGNGRYSVCDFTNYQITKTDDGGFMDYGWATYAGQTFNNYPRTDVRHHLAWITHSEQDIAYYDGKPFSQCMSLIGSLELHKTPYGYRLFRKPGDSMKKLRQSERTGSLAINGGYTFQISRPCELTIGLKKNQSFSFMYGECRFSYDSLQHKIYVTGFRHQFGHERGQVEAVECPEKDKEYLLCNSTALFLDIFMDETVVEVFINEEISISVPVIAEKNMMNITASELELDYTEYSLASIWNKSRWHSPASRNE